MCRRHHAAPGVRGRRRYDQGTGLPVQRGQAGAWRPCVRGRPQRVVSRRRCCGASPAGVPPAGVGCWRLRGRGSRSLPPQRGVRPLTKPPAEAVGGEERRAGGSGPGGRGPAQSSPSMACGGDGPPGTSDRCERLGRTDLEQPERVPCYRDPRDHPRTVSPRVTEFTQQGAFSEQQEIEERFLSWWVKLKGDFDVCQSSQEKKAG